MRTPTAEEREAIGRTLREAREGLGRTQTAVAEKLGIGQEMISRYEAGKVSRPNLAVLMELSSEVGCNPLTLIAPFFSDGFGAKAVTPTAITAHKPSRRRPLEVAS